jgi:hypothetical protein
VDFFKSEVLIDPVALADILLAVALTPVEVSGLGRVERNGRTYSIAPDIVVFRQTCSMGGTQFDETAHANWVHEMMRSGNGELINKHRLWWHSHVYHGSVFSSTDDAQMERLAGTPDEWWLRLVANKYGKFSLCLDKFKPHRQTEEIKKIGFTSPTGKEHMRGLMLERKERMRREIAEKVVVFEPDQIELILLEIFK